MKKNILFVLICWLGSVNCGGWGSDNSKRVRLQDVQASFQGGRGVNERGRLGRAPRPAFYTLAKNMSLNGGATHFTLGLRSCIISHPFLKMKYTCAPSENYPIAPPCKFLFWGGWDNLNNNRPLPFILINL